MCIRDSLRTVQDWIIAPQMRSTPGLAGVDTIGGYVKEYAVHPDPVSYTHLDVYKRQHGTCAHNHCHHASASILQEMAMVPLQVKRLLPAGGNETWYPSSTLDGPIRPPQA